MSGADEKSRACRARDDLVIGPCGRDEGHSGMHRSAGDTFTAWWGEKTIEAHQGAEPEPEPEVQTKIPVLVGAVGEHTVWVDGQGAYCSCPWHFQDNTGDDEVPYRAASQHLAWVKSQAEIAGAEQEESESGPSIPIMEVEDLAESGLLWYINATAFHPHGVALTYSDADGDIHFGLTPALPGEPCSFPDDPYIHERYRAAMATLHRARWYTEEGPAFTRTPWETMPPST